MENSTNTNSKKQGEGELVGHSEFLRRFSSLPLVNAMLLFTMNIYTKAKSSVWIVGKASDWMENTIKLVSGFAGPIVNQLSPLAASPLAKVDDLATKGLDTLERTVPAIKKQPNEIVADTKEMISSKVSPAVERLNNASEQVLSSKVVQLSFDVYENVLSRGSALVNNCLSSPKLDQNGQQNGFPRENKPESGAARAVWLCRESFFFVCNTTQRLFGIAQSRVDSAVHGAESVVTSVKKSL
jgi:hypothetical protein